MTIVFGPQETSSTDTRAPLAVLGVYHLLERVGAGALGEVFRARDTVHGRTVAIKRVPAVVVADPARSQALKETAQGLSAVSHPGVAILYECGEHDGELFLAQEYVPGQSLTQLLGGRALNPRRALDLAIEAAEALAALHAVGRLHGDVRPDNIVVTPKGHLKLLDAGLAAFTGGGALRATAASRLGTLTPSTLPVLRYLAPEQALGEGGDARSDLFALGAVLYEMLVGTPAFERPAADDTLIATLHSSPEAPSAKSPSVPKALDGIVARALAKPLNARYQDAGSLVSDLRRVKADFDRELEAAPLFEPPAADRRSRVWVLVVLVLAVLAGIAWWQTDLLLSLFG